MSERKTIQFSIANDRDLDAVIDLHMNSMSALLTDLGRSFVRRYYEVALADPASILMCARDLSGEIVGWAMASPDPRGLSNQMSFPRAWFVAQIAKLVMCRPGVFMQLVRSVVISQRDMQLPERSIELVYIGVSALARGKGVGGGLLAAILRVSSERGFSKLLLSVEVENQSAVALYRACGFDIESTYVEGRYHRHRMSKQLSA